MLALSGLCEGFARGWACLHAACPECCRSEHLPVPKIPADKPCISLTSKLIEIKRLQVLHFGHLRKTGGRGFLSLPFSTLATRCPLTLSRAHWPLSPLFPLHTKSADVTPLFPLLTQKQGSTPRSKKCRRADIFDFSPYFSQFCRPEIDSRKRRPRSKTSSSLADSDSPAGAHPDDGASIAPRVRCAT
jgi:hypothetical protein